MWSEIVAILQRAPEIALFLSLAIGYSVGSVPLIGRVTLGPTVSTLLAAVAIGQAGIVVDPLIKSVLFALFIFTVGYRSGPQFVASFKRTAGPELALALVLAATGIAATVLVAKLFGLDKGAAGGLMAGALTQSPALGTTTDAISRLGLPPDQAKTLADSAAVAYAVSYLFGEFGLLMFVRNVAPVLLRTNLKEAAAKLEAEHHGDGQGGDGQLVAYHPLDVRAYRVTRTGVPGQSVAEVESLLGNRTIIPRLKRGDAVRPARPDLRVDEGDVLCVIGPRATLTDKAGALLGDEVDEPAVLGFKLQTLDVVVTNAAFDGQSLREIAGTFGPATRGLSVSSIHRVEQALPVTPGTRLQVGDVIRLVGDERQVGEAAAALGYADWPTDKSDLVFLGVGIVLGTLLGLVSATVFGIPLTLGTGGGVLIAGLVLGWLRAKRPTFGKMPPAAQWVFSDFGLNGFIATIGLSIGASAVHAIVQQGAWLVAGGIIVTLLPLLVATFFGSRVLGMNPVILCGALAGAQTNAAVLNAVNEAAESTMPVLGFTLPFAVNNMLLTIAAPIIVALV